MADAADLNAQVGLRRARLPRVAAAAMDGGGAVLGVNLGLHRLPALRAAPRPGPG